MNTSELVQPRHLDRKAMIYVRQSSPNQVITNKESQRMQYALRERSATLGWHERDIQVIDADLGRSGATTEGRVGYQDLVAQIALGEVGILLAFDATRLARNCSHWYQLLDLCGHHDCLIAENHRLRLIFNRLGGVKLKTGLSQGYFISLVEKLAACRHSVDVNRIATNVFYVVAVAFEPYPGLDPGDVGVLDDDFTLFRSAEHKFILVCFKNRSGIIFEN